ncbi:2-oxoglutarate dehydrogenase E1 component [Gregarina niphandrodes]|uniref:2-oxoglutarate dehydrogenase E1 component n=1 Tax=Gregarina niphandrodes TaxID=110365 RepID=A0A023B1P8_GRENI|nr:2-oxoglutarate dehydrogenase E1 component [Gregarina niphandrodes]EZG47695.1 2-oxoglutarate dehydrogenase E1 component [Gregarina niphandrodes]|eukprot:XP_011132148.1 2-oxoglutarate dehydrogenase E1 component [Gregarina niphandrodes]
MRVDGSAEVSAGGEAGSNVERGSKPVYNAKPEGASGFKPLAALVDHDDGVAADLVTKVVAMLRYFEKLGHYHAETDPLSVCDRGYPHTSVMRDRNRKQCENTFESFGFNRETDWDQKVSVSVPQTAGLLGELKSDTRSEWQGVHVAELPTSRRQEQEEGDETWSIGELYKRLKEIYCGHIGVEYLHIHNREKINWLRSQLELPRRYCYTRAQKLLILDRVMRAVIFEQFAAAKFGTIKRFGLDGCEGFVVGLEQLLKCGVLHGVESVVVSMAHRGRLNTLMNIMRKPKSQVFSEFMGHTGFGGAAWGNSGDVKYHMGAEIIVTDPDVQKDILYTLLPNPSHLEAVDPVCLGTARARQDLIAYGKGTRHSPATTGSVTEARVAHEMSVAGATASVKGVSGKGEAAGAVSVGGGGSREDSFRRVLPVIVHGDASISGQGVVYETCQMSNLAKYSVGGTVHVVINNQIGFTTDPGDGASGNYCTDVAKCIEAPVFHVNGDDPEAISRVMEIALMYRQKFHSDVFVDVIGYRRSGHNELDMPKFTQPLLYDAIGKHENLMDLYLRQLIHTDKVITQEEANQLQQKILQEFIESFEKAKTYKPTPHLRPFNPEWRTQCLPDEFSRPRITGVSLNELVDIGTCISTLPSGKGLQPHSTIKRVYDQRLQCIKSGKGIDFGLAEALAFATLIKDGVHIRLMGQDCERGTFSHRHAVVKDQVDPRLDYFPLDAYAQYLKGNLPKGQSKAGETGTVAVGNSLLSEFACLGFEYGYSLESPFILPIWEAQFGDFANGAQVIIDQFLVSGEVKWNHPSGLTLLLPHGYDGQGSEHSSGRIERFLQMCDDPEDTIHQEVWDINRRSVVQRHNIQVCNVTTPANYFHVLRRQIHRGFRKPLVVFSPKRLLRLKESSSNLMDMAENTRFSRYIFDPAFITPQMKYTSEIGVNPSGKDAQSRKRENVKRLILCSGQVYYDLVKARQDSGMTDEVMIGRVEQLSPFPFDQIAEDITSLPYLRSIVWCQEEPMNMGAWSYAKPRVETLLKHLGHQICTITFAGRNVSAAPATGDTNIHKKELQQILEHSMNLDKNHNSHVAL